MQSFINAFIFALVGFTLYDLFVRPLFLSLLFFSAHKKIKNNFKEIQKILATCQISIIIMKPRWLSFVSPICFIHLRKNFITKELSPTTALKIIKILLENKLNFSDTEIIEMLFTDRVKFEISK